MDELKLSRFDTNVFAAHSSRSAFVNKAKMNEMRIKEIMKEGCWKRESTFTKFYGKDIQ